MLTKKRVRSSLYWFFEYVTLLGIMSEIGNPHVNVVRVMFGAMIVWGTMLYSASLVPTGLTCLAVIVSVLSIFVGNCIARIAIFIVTKIGSFFINFYSNLEEGE